jgi:hypothetical protein
MDSTCFFKVFNTFFIISSLQNLGGTVLKLMLKNKNSFAQKEVHPIPAELVSNWKKNVFAASNRRLAFLGIVGAANARTNFLHIELIEGDKKVVRVASIKSMSLDTFGFRKKHALENIERKEREKGVKVGLIRIYTQGGPAADSFFVSLPENTEAVTFDANQIIDHLNSRAY